MAVGTAIAVGASVNSAIAMQRAREAKEIACKEYTANFKGSKDIESARQYSECVQLLYPKDNVSDILFGKVIFIVAVVSFILGAIFLEKGYKDGPIDYFMFGIIGMALGLTGALLFGLFIAGLGMFL